MFHSVLNFFRPAEFHHIVGAFSKAIGRLEDLAERKVAEADAEAAKIAAATEARLLAVNESSRATATAAKIKSMLTA